MSPRTCTTAGASRLASKAITGHASLPVISPIRKQDSLGGHAFALVGFNRTGFVVQNSWGDKWGNCGFGVLPYEEWVQIRHGRLDRGARRARERGEDYPLVPVRSKEKVVIARAGAYRLHLDAEAAAAEGEQGSRARGAPRRRIATRVVMGNDGDVINRIVTHRERGELRARRRVRCAASTF